MDSDTDEINSFKEDIIILLNDYIEIKKIATELGYDQNSLKFTDYLDAFIKNKKKL